MSCLHAPTTFRRRPLATFLALLCTVPAYAVETPAGSETSLSAITVTGNGDYAASTEKSGLYTTRKSASATGLNLSLRETPQTVSVISRSQLDDFRLTSVNDALAASSGVMVERVETDRTYYTARGFDITNFQTGGVGQPFVYGNVNGDIDTAIYDRIDAVYGANGLISATGFPSATINFVRKRPTAEFGAAAGLTVGFWDKYRIETDVSGKLIDSGRIRGRLVFAREEAGSYLDRYERDKTVGYGIVEADLGESTLLAVGHSQQRNKTQGGMWGALPMLYSNGRPTNYDVSTSTSADWSHWNSTFKTSFAELTHQFNDDWSAKATLTRNDYSNEGALFYAYGTPNQATGLGLYSYPSLYEMKNRQTQVDASISGKFALLGRSHEVNFGFNHSKSQLDDVSHYGQGIGTALPALENWTGNYPMPAFTASVDGSAFVFKQQSAFGVVRLSLVDDLKLIAGARATKAESEGTSYGVGRRSEASAVTPYAGLIYDLNRNLSAYVSYTDIFTPQYQMDASGNALQPVQGRSREVGLKGEFFDRKLNASLALFKSEQRNLAETAGYIGALAYYKGIDADSKGFQIDLAGQVTPRLQASLGYTQLAIHDDAGNDVRTYTPRRLLRATATYRVPGVDSLKVGGNLSWQSATYRDASAGEIRQDAYAVVNLMARYDIDKQWSVSANLNNLTDEKYIASLYWEQAYYAAPRNASLSLNWKY
jgi:outer membrane receptor for ferric coprogen and ferric-rhodotorulic acid